MDFFYKVKGGTAIVTAPAWQNVGVTQDGAGALLTLGDPIVAGQFFYRILITP